MKEYPLPAEFADRFKKLSCDKQAVDRVVKMALEQATDDMAALYSVEQELWRDVRKALNLDTACQFVVENSPLVGAPVLLELPPEEDPGMSKSIGRRWQIAKREGYQAYQDWAAGEGAATSEPMPENPHRRGVEKGGWEAGFEQARAAKETRDLKLNKA